MALINWRLCKKEHFQLCKNVKMFKFLLCIIIKSVFCERTQKGVLWYRDNLTTVMALDLSKEIFMFTVNFSVEVVDSGGSAPTPPASGGEFVNSF